MSLRTGPLLAALAYAGAAFLFGLALGERGELGFVQHIFAVVIPLATFVLALIAHPSRRANVFLTGVTMFAGLTTGQHQFDRAWIECLTRAPLVRAAVARYHEDNDVYPARLEELPIDLPCKCGLRPTILHYASNDRGFRLWMTNEAEVVEFSKSARTP